MPSPCHKAYCTAPWVEVHLYNDGQTRLCDHNQESIGNWQQNGVENVWRGERYQEVRRKMMAGEFPNEQCRACYLNQTTSRLGNHVRRHFTPLVEKLEAVVGRHLPELRAFDSLLEAAEAPESWRETLAAFRSRAASLRAEAPAQLCAVEHLERLAGIAEDFLSGSLSPKHVGPSRQVRLINKCNARCIMCAGNFNGDIVNGPGMDERFLEEALSPTDDIICFSSETSELLLFRRWRELAGALAGKGLPKLRIFTNGILMTRENARYLVDNKVLDTLHFSMNGASREVIESGQVNVKYDALLANIRHVFEYAQEKGADFHLAFSFIIMRRNHHEMAELVRLVHRLRGQTTALKPSIYFAFLESNNDMDNYREFLFREHHALVPEAELRASFEAAQAEADRLGIPVTLFESTLAAHLRSGRKAPKLVCKDRDLKVLTRLLREGKVSRDVLGAVEGTTPRLEKLLARLRDEPASIGEVEDAVTGRDLLLSARADVSVHGFDSIESSAANKWRWALGTRQTVRFAPFPGGNAISFRLLLPVMHTELSLRSDGVEVARVRSATQREVVAGRIEFANDGRDQRELEIVCAEPPPVVPGDARPLAYTVYSFEHIQTDPA